MPQNTGDWPSKKDVATRLNISEKTIDRAILKGLIEVGYRRVPGRRPIVVLRPEDVAVFELQLAAPRAAETRAVVGLKPTAQTTLFLSLEQASELAGLSMATLQKFIDAGTLPTVETDEGLRIRRRDLESL